MGLPGAGKTTLAEALSKLLAPSCIWSNADRVRKAYNDWDFTTEGRIRQAHRMRQHADNTHHKYHIADFVAPLTEMRDIYSADYTIWVDTISQGRFEDTNQAFTVPTEYTLRVTTQDAEYWAREIVKILG